MSIKESRVFDLDWNSVEEAFNVIRDLIQYAVDKRIFTESSKYILRGELESLYQELSIAKDRV